MHVSSAQQFMQNKNKNKTNTTQHAYCMHVINMRAQIRKTVYYTQAQALLAQLTQAQRAANWGELDVEEIAMCLKHNAQKH